MKKLLLLTALMAAVLPCRADIITIEFSGITTDFSYSVASSGSPIDPLIAGIVPGQTTFSGWLSYDTAPPLSPYPPDMNLDVGPLHVSWLGFSWWHFDGTNFDGWNPNLYVDNNLLITTSATVLVGLQVGGTAWLQGDWPYETDWQGNPIVPYDMIWSGVVTAINGNSVPEGGSTLAMLGLAVAGCACLRKYKVQ